MSEPVSSYLPGIGLSPISLSAVQRDALVRAHQFGHRYPALWNARLRQTLVDRGLLEERDEGWRLTDAGVALAQRLAEGRR